MDASVELKRVNLVSLSAKATAGNAPDCLELGLRLHAGCNTPADVRGALALWNRVAETNHPQHTTGATLRDRARTFSCIAYAYEKLCKEDPDYWQIDDLHRAAVAADHAAELGLISSTVLLPRGPGVDPKRYVGLHALWAALEARDVEVRAEQMKRDVKTAKAPNAYFCAAEGCGIESRHKSNLMRCAGPCTADIKPSYCGKECQRQDWKRHKPLCKPGSQISAASSSGKLASTSNETKSAEEPINEERFNKSGGEYTMEWPAPGAPGGKIKVSSTTMSPAHMKATKEAIEKELQETTD